MSLVLQKAEITNLPEITKILKEENLVYQDMGTENIDFFLAHEKSLFIGIIGLEKYKGIGLLRSLVVKMEHRNKGYGAKICKELMNYAKKNEISELFLLTCTAKNFFEKIGFEIVERDNVPDLIKNTQEFSNLCPSTAVCIHINL